MADVFRCDAALEKLVAYLVPSCHIREADGEIGLAVMDEVQFLTFRLRQCCVYPTLLQVSEQCRMLEFPDLQLLKGRLECLLAKRERNRTDVWSLFRYLTEQIRHIVGTMEFLRQSDDVATLADTEVIPLVEFGVYLERGFGFLSQR